MGKTSKEVTNPFLGDAIREVVENQIRDRIPIETGETLERLIKAGYSRQEAIDKIGAAIVGEIHLMLKSSQPYDQKRYVGRLRELK